MIFKSYIYRLAVRYFFSKDSKTIVNRINGFAFSSIDAASPGSGSAVMPPLPPNDWRLSHLDGDAEATASRYKAGYDPLANRLRDNWFNSFKSNA